MTEEGKSYYPSLTGIRAIAAWCVFIHHFNFFSEKYFGKYVHNFFAEFHIGVTIFFVLSGMLITLRYYDNSINSGTSFYNYMVKRFARIYPVFFLVLIINFIWFLSLHIYTNTFYGGWIYFIGSATFVRGFFDNSINAPVPQSWSLTVEECFYFSAPFIFFLLKKNLRNLIVIPVLLITTGILLTWFFIDYPFHGLLSDFHFLFNFTFFGRCIEFFAGITVALIFKNRSPARSNSLKFTMAGILVIFLCVLGLSLLHTDEHFGDYPPEGIFINNFLLPVAGISILFWGLLTEANFVTRFLASGMMTSFGKSSYIFYLVHVGFFAMFFYNSISHNPIFNFIFINIISVLLYWIFEYPVNKWLRKKLLIKDYSFNSETAASKHQRP